MFSMERSVIRQLLIFPFSFLFHAAEQVYNTLTITGLLWKVCENLYVNDTTVDCLHILQNRTSTDKVMQRVQNRTGNWQTYSIIANILPLIIVVPVIGAMSDRFGRKYAILMGNSAMIVGSLMFFLEFYFPLEAPFFAIPLVIGVASLLGYNAVTPLSCYSYIADSSDTPDILTFRLTAIYFVNNIASIITGVLASFFLTQLTAAYSLLIPMGIWLVSFIYALVFLKQIPPKCHSKVDSSNATAKDEEKISYDAEFTLYANQTPSKGHSSNQIRKMLMLISTPFKTARRKREGNFFWYLMILLLTTIIASIPAAGMNSVTTIFASGDPLEWNASQILMYRSINILCELFGMVISTFGLQRHLQMKDTSSLIVALVSVMLRYVLIGTAFNDAMMYVSCVVGLFSGMIQPLISSLMAQLVDKDEVGQIMAIFWLGLGIGQLVSSTGLMKMLTATLSIYSGIVFLFVAGAVLIAIMLNIWLHFDWKRHRNISSMQ